MKIMTENTVPTVGFVFQKLLEQCIHRSNIEYSNTIVATVVNK